jgi:hypothetical protein
LGFDLLGANKREQKKNRGKKHHKIKMERFEIHREQKIHGIRKKKKIRTPRERMANNK